MINQAWDSGKIIISTNKVKAEYAQVLDEEGKPKMEGGRPVREKTGKMVRSGYNTTYLWQIKLVCLSRPAGVNKYTNKPTPATWGVRILMCKTNTQLVGTELWGDSCSVESLVQTVYPHIPLSAWGY
jgi:hypothetical protein